ncbi:MAG: ATP-binding protein [Gammaproteobacteria bacterium]
MKRLFRSALGTTAFRTAAFSALIYAALTGAMIAAIYPLVAEQIQAQISTGLQAESTALASLYNARGVAALASVIHIRSNDVLPPDDDADADDPGRRYYALIDARGQILAGDIKRWPVSLPKNGWGKFQFKRHTVRALITRLPNGDTLLVGQSLAITNALGQQTLLLVVSGAIIALLAGLAGGVFIGARVMRSIQHSSATAERIEKGHLDERLATGGPGEHDALARAFNAMLARIETTVLSLRDLSARTAHEVRHPLTRMEQTLTQAENANSLEAARILIRESRDQIDELARRTEAVLRLARLEGDRERRKFFSEFDLGKLVADVVELYTPTAEERNLSLRVSAAGTLTFFGDKQLLAQALANLLDNAIRYARPHAAVEITMHRTSHGITVEAGNAVDTESAGEADASTGQAGNNLGLPIARAIAQLHHGQLVIDSTPERFIARLIFPQSQTVI